MRVIPISFRRAGDQNSAEFVTGSQCVRQRNERQLAVTEYHG